jgi:hypothetical protein
VVTASSKSSAPFAYDYQKLVALPSIAGISPVGGPTAGGTLVRILGSSFRSVGDVYFVEVNASTLVRSNNSLPCTPVVYTDTLIR